MREVPLTLLLLLLLVAVPAAQAEYAVLRNGQRLHITGYQRTGSSVRLHVGGGSVEIPAAELLGIEPEEVFAGFATPAPTVPFGELIRDAAQKHGLDEELIATVIAAESNFNPRAVSRRHAQGLMQLLPGTARGYAVADVFNPKQNINAGARYLKQLLERYNYDLALALAAYNAGPERVKQYRGVPPFTETRAYVREVTQKLQGRKRLASREPTPTASTGKSQPADSLTSNR